MKRFATAVMLATSAISALPYTVVRGTLSDSAIYPATTHSYVVTIPDSYDGMTPAALYIGLDGILCNAPDVIDSLIKSGDMPVTVGVFLQPGVVTGTDNSVIRYNRSNEFDATDDTFARFLETELLPEISRLTLDDGRKIIISPDPDRRMIFGLSSGGNAAFVAAWNRPDLFRRVFSGCGTFVPMRGANEMQAIVRKHEPKPLRIFLQDGFSDTWNPLFGSWYEANVMLGSALQFAGYDCAFDWQEGGHSVKRASEIFKDVMKWIWADSVSPISPGKTGNDFLAQLLVDGETWTENSRKVEFTGSSAVYPDSSLMAFADDRSDWLTQALLDDDGQPYAAQRFYWLHSPYNRPLTIGGMAFDAGGNLWVITDSGLQICDQNGRVRAILSLPRDFEVRHSGIIIGDGEILINRYRRVFNVKSPVTGVRPDSQGQG